MRIQSDQPEVYVKSPVDHSMIRVTAIFRRRRKANDFINSNPGSSVVATLKDQYILIAGTSNEERPSPSLAEDGDIDKAIDKVIEQDKKRKKGGKK